MNATCSWCSRPAVALAETATAVQMMCAACIARSRRVERGAYPTLGCPSWRPGRFDVTPGKPRAFFHGTSARLAEIIRREGLQPGGDGRVYFTTSHAMAQRYAMLAAMRDALLPQPHGAGHVGVVVRFEPEHAAPYEREHRSAPPPLPWETMRCWGDAYYRRAPIPPAALAFESWRITDLDGVAADDPHARAVIADWFARVELAYPREWIAPGDRGARAAGPLHDALPEPVNLLVGSHQHPDSAVHGAAHALAVAAAGIRLLEAGCPADPAVLLAFAILHDSQRHSEGHDPEHGARAAQLARRVAGIGHRLNARQLDTLSRALVDHDRGFTSTDPTIGACWDADRLTLPRVGITPDPRLLSTEAGRSLATILWHLPTADQCDWQWALSRFYMLDQHPADVAQLAQQFRAAIAREAAGAQPAGMAA